MSNSSFIRLITGSVVVLFSSLSSLHTSALAQSLSERDDQLKFCATYIPCMIMVGIGDAGVGAITWTEALKSRFNQIFWKSTVRSPEDFRRYLDSLSPPERQGLIAKCTELRGRNMLEYCESEYLNADEMSALKRSRGRQGPKNRDYYSNLRDDLIQRDERLAVNAREHCGLVRANSANPNVLKYDVNRLEKDMHYLNSEAGFLENFSSMRSNALAVLNECMQRDELGNWEYKSVLNPAQTNEPWMNLPVRPGIDATVAKELKSVLENTSRAPTNQSDPFTGTSNLLSQEAIASERQKFKRDQESARAFIDLTLAVAQQALLIEQQKTADRLAAQQLARNQAEIARLNQNQVASSTQSTTVYYTQSNQQAQQTTGSSSNPTTNGNSGAEGNSGPGSSSTSGQQQALQCISVSRTPNSWATMTNSCGHRVTVSWCYKNSGDCKYGTWGTKSTGNIGPGASRSASALISNSNQYDLYYVACTGTNTSITEPSAGSFICGK